MKILFINGAEIVTVSKIMGHNSSKTTEIYTHVSTKNIQQIKSPFDDL
jgi:integrase/recombinase XerD